MRHCASVLNRYCPLRNMLLSVKCKRLCICTLIPNLIYCSDGNVWNVGFCCINSLNLSLFDKYFYLCKWIVVYLLYYISFNCPVIFEFLYFDRTNFSKKKKKKICNVLRKCLIQTRSHAHEQFCSILLKFQIFFDIRTIQDKQHNATKLKMKILFCWHLHISTYNRILSNIQWSINHQTKWNVWHIESYSSNELKSIVAWREYFEHEI